MEKSLEQSDKTEEIKRLEKALKTEQARAKEYLDRLKYLQADFENYRKRLEKETQETVQRSNEKLIANLLTMMDDLERALETGKRTENVGALLQGVEMIYKNLCAMLEHEGLRRIDSLGKPFDPNTHEILAKVPAKDCEEGTVVEEVRKGFMFKGKVIRPSVVKIALRKEKEDE